MNIKGDMNKLFDERSYSSPSVRVTVLQSRNVYAGSFSGTTHEGYTEEVIIS